MAVLGSLVPKIVMTDVPELFWRRSFGVMLAKLVVATASRLFSVNDYVIY